MPQHIVVKEYNKNYPFMYEKEKELIIPILKDNLVNIYHIGSTAIPNLKSKPIIDIMISVINLDDVDKLKKQFEDIGYEYLFEFGIKGRRYLRKGWDERTHQIHIFQKDDKYNLIRHLAVRDYLISHQNVAYEYGKLKQFLANKYPYDIDGYCDGKEEFVKNLEKDALNWYQKLNAKEKLWLSII